MFDALQFLQSYGIEHWTEGKNVQEGWVGVQCPLCGDHSNHGGFNLAGGYYHCWRCGGSSIGWIVKQFVRVSYSEALKIVDRFDTEEGTQAEEKEKREFFVPGGPVEDRHLRYLESRGFGMEEVKKYGIRGTGRTGDYAHRIVYPVYHEDRAVSWQARTMMDVSPKYMACPNNVSKIPIKEILYNLDNCRRRKCVVFEGALACWRFGDDSCAVLGADYSKEQAVLLSERFDEVYIIFDEDEAGRMKGEELGILLEGGDVYTEIVEIGKDVDDLSKEEVRQLRRELIETT